jgi:hypothetical protein
MKEGWLTKLLCRIFPYKEIGWHDIGEVFYRWRILKLFGYQLYLHRLYAPNWHSQCHDHPWNFWALILSGGYFEKITGRNTNHGLDCGNNTYWRRPGSLLYRPAAFKHNVVTPKNKVNWSLVLMAPKSRDWGFMKC